MKNEKAKAERYQREKNSIFFIEFALTIAVLSIVQSSGLSGWLKIQALSITDEVFFHTAVYATFLAAILYLASIPLSFYKGFILEHKFDLSNQKLTDWLRDEFKGLIITYIIYLLFVEFLYLFIRNFPESWWIWIAGVWILFGIIFTKLMPVVIIPLFFKFKELENKRLKKRLIRLAKSCGIKILDVFKLDLSAKSRKANAALAGMGNTRRILLADTLLENYTEEEIEVVMAHELAHHKFKHIRRSIISGGASTLIGFYLIHISIKTAYDIAVLPLMFLFLTVLSMLVLPIQNLYSRNMEKRADLYAVKLTGMPESFISCMEKLAKQNLAVRKPSKFIEIMLYNHPPISERVGMARDLMKNLSRRKR